jgi:putative hemolysin
VLPEEDRGLYNTLSGLIMMQLGRMPRTTDRIDWEGWTFEIMDMDGTRIDKVLASRNTTIDENCHD